jgi:hypothetical protein
MEKVQNRRFSTGETITIDGKSYARCTFDGCEVVYGGGEVYWENCTWANCRITLVEHANRTVQVLEAWGYKIIPPNPH